MKIDFTKIIDFLQPSYNQLKYILILTLGAMSIIYFYGMKTANYQRDIIDTDKKIERNLQSVNTLRDDFELYKIQNRNDIVKLYNDMLEIGHRNNAHWMIKFNLLIQYGNNPQLLKQLLEIQNEQQKLYEEERKKNMEYLFIEVLKDSIF